jgi:hypothetical protein
MIKYILLFLVVISCSVSQATVRTVNNYITNSAQFSTVQPAITASATNDTIYLHGSPVSYGDFTITKRLVIIGAGYYLSNTINNYTTLVGNITIDTVSVNQALSGLTLQGLTINGQISNAGTDRANNVLIDRCKLSTTFITGSNWIIKNSFGSPSFTISSISSNVLISNNIFQSLYLGNGSSLISYAAGVKVSNNELGGLYIGSGFYILFVNNIIKNYTVGSYSINNTFSRNITFTDGGPSINFPPPNNTGSGNFNNINPLYINYSSPWPNSHYSGDLLSYDFNYQTGSVAINGGTDSTNIGISGGPYPTLTTKIFDGRTKIPLVTDVNIENAYVKPGQSIQIHFKARKNN